MFGRVSFACGDEVNLFPNIPPVCSRVSPIARMIVSGDVASLVGSHQFRAVRILRDGHGHLAACARMSSCSMTFNGSQEPPAPVEIRPPGVRQNHSQPPHPTPIFPTTYSTSILIHLTASSLFSALFRTSGQSGLSGTCRSIWRTPGPRFSLFRHSPKYDRSAIISA